MQEYERVAFEPERASPRQGDRDRWSEGEKLQAEPNQMGRVSPRTTILVSMIVVVVILCVLLFFLLFFFFGSLAFVHVSSGAFPGGGPGPIHHTLHFP